MGTRGSICKRSSCWRDHRYIEKAFNHLPREVIFQTALVMGLPQALLVSWAGALGSLERRFQIQQHIGPAVRSTTGFPEGCALSCIGIMLMDCLFHKWFEQSFPLCQPISCVDDLQLITNQPDDVPQLMSHLLRFAELVDLQIDTKKTFTWSNQAVHRTDFRKEGLRVKLHAKGLGAQLHFGRKHTTEVLRLRSGRNCAHQSAHTSVKSWLSSRQHGPEGCMGWRHLQFPNFRLHPFLRSQVMRGIGAEGAGCNPMVHLGCVEAPVLDPQLWSILETFRVVRESASEDGLQMLLKEAISPDSRIPPFSLTRLLVDRIHYLGWTCTKGVKICDTLGEFSLQQISYAELVYRASHAWGQVVSSTVAHRPSFQGLERSDFQPTRTFLQGLDPVDQGLFRKALNGAHFTNDMV